MRESEIEKLIELIDKIDLYKKEYPVRYILCPKARFHRLNGGNISQPIDQSDVNERK